MKELVNEQELKKFNLYGNILSIHFVLLIALSIPLFIWVIQYAFFPFGFLFILTMYRALKVEKIKKENDVQTYKEIPAFTEEKKLDEITKMVEKGKRPYQNILKVLLSAFITAILCFLIGFFDPHNTTIATAKLWLSYFILLNLKRLHLQLKLHRYGILI